MDINEGTAHAPGAPSPFVGTVGAPAPEPVPLHLQRRLAPVRWILAEWTAYLMRFADATHLRIGSTTIPARLTDTIDGARVGLFDVRFENHLGIARIEPLRDGLPCGEPFHVEVIAGKFQDADHALAFLEATLADLFAHGATLPFVLAAPTGRTIRDAFLAPNDLFAFHFFRHRGREIVRATQAVLGAPHRVLTDRVDNVRLHQARQVDREALLALVTSANASGDPGGTPSSGSIIQRLRPERVRQRLPEESHDTPENRFIATAGRRMLRALERIDRAPWYRNAPIPASDRDRLREVRQHLRHLLTDPRFAALEASVRIPAHSRVLQHRDGYRDITLLWQDFHRSRQPVFDDLQTAIDLRDIATLYEFWLLFELMARIEDRTGITPILKQAFDHLGHPVTAFRARFPGHGTLHFQRGFTGSNVYSGILLKPDFVWESPDGRRVVMDAKFRLQHPWPSGDEPDTPSLNGTRAKTDDITKMHAYRDAIDGVTAAIVLYPGATTEFRTTGGESLPITIDDIIAGDLHGVGAIAMSPEYIEGVIK